MNKRYEYDGFIYCKDDLDEEIDNYGGDLDDLFFQLYRDGKADSDTFYYASHTSECYKNRKDLIENEFSDLEVKENDCRFKNHIKEKLNERY